MNRALAWKAASYGAGALATIATRRVLVAAWSGVRSSAPPEQQADRSVSWPEALSWAIATGIGVGVARLVAVRSAAVVREAATHEPPPSPQ